MRIISFMFGGHLLARKASEGYKVVLTANRTLIRKCKEEYYYDLTAMIQDQRNGKISVGPAPIRFIYNYLRQNK